MGSCRAESFKNVLNSKFGLSSLVKDWVEADEDEDANVDADTAAAADLDAERVLSTL